ncbi:acyltransferase family protein [Neotamlana laminarinivorans]|uniref:Acyltransferase family protein n=1 Tax=Neotamlana laminarinivorans TaxID=2883124 RepID=A0A9X1HXP7_9FLAO|nr:acyltransferase family protein [Tamlana laminarinivorans]MCB4797496.1 acyltransferase family protein [Tamlana laminarinivorans]
MQPITTSKERIYGLDLVRAIAILLILSSHSTILIFQDSELKSIKFNQFFGTVGVNVFFVLSGFNKFLILLSYWVLSFMLAYLMFNYLEKTILKFRDRNINA